MRYIYAIISRSERSSFGDIGLDESPVTTVVHRDICAVVSPLEKSGITAEDARPHERVLRSLMVEPSIIPMTFGFILEDEEQVLNLLTQGYHVFVDTLKRLENKMQVNIKISWDKHVLNEVLLDEEVRTLVKKGKETTDDVSLKIELGRRVKESLLELEKKLLPEVLVLRELAVGFKENHIRNDDLILNASLLVENENHTRYIETIEELEKKFKGTLLFQSVLPLPPYNFVDIRIEHANFNEIDKARKTLGLGVSVSPSTVQIAYEKLVRLHHPDVSDDPNSMTRFNEINHAYRTLRDFTDHYSCPLTLEEVENKFLFKTK